MCVLVDAVGGSVGVRISPLIVVGSGCGKIDGGVMMGVVL